MLRIYVGNLSLKTTEQELNALFAEHGPVESCTIITDLATGRSLGFGFVSMPDDTKARAAVSALNGADLGGRKLRINEA